jgi:hypothetical protein
MRFAKGCPEVFEADGERAFDEIVYFLGAAIDLDLYIAFSKHPLRDALGLAFLNRFYDFIEVYGCPPMPDGEWIAGNIWACLNEWPEDNGTPRHNFYQRLLLYKEGIHRAGEGKFPGESYAFILSSLCGPRAGLSFITTAAGLFLGQFEVVRLLRDEFEVM